MRARSTLVWAIAACLMGCGDSSDSSANRTAITGDKGRIYQEVKPGETVKHNEDVKLMVDALRVYAPAGRISGNGRFWDVVIPWAGSPDEQRLLDANGIRVGIMSEADWPRIKRIMEESPSVVSQSTTMAGSVKGWLDTRDLTRATVFYYDRQFNLQGRAVDESQTSWGVFYAPEPTKKNLVSLEVSPIIRSKQRQMKPVRFGEDLEIEYIQAQTIYDLGIKTQLPLGAVLVLAPTVDAARCPSSLGCVFLMDDEESTLAERVLFIYPRAYRFSAKETERAAEQNKQKTPQTTVPKVQ